MYMTNYEKFGTSIYNPDRDGSSIVAYYERIKASSANPLFHGSEHFYLFKAAGALTIRVTVIRLMWGIGNDEAFTVVEECKLEGMDDVAVHTARSGIFTPEELLDATDAPRFEISWLNPHIL